MWDEYSLLPVSYQQPFHSQKEVTNYPLNCGVPFFCFNAKFLLVVTTPLPGRTPQISVGLSLLVLRISPIRNHFFSCRKAPDCLTLATGLTLAFLQWLLMGEFLNTASESTNLQLYRNLSLTPQQGCLSISV